MTPQEWAPINPMWRTVLFHPIGDGRRGRPVSVVPLANLQLLELFLTLNIDAETHEHLRPDLDSVLQKFDPVTHQFRTNATSPNLPSLASTTSTGRTSRSTSLFSRQQPSSTLPSQYETDLLQEHEPTKTSEQDAVALASSSVRATHGSDSSTSASTADEIEYIWNLGDQSSQFDVSGARTHPRRRRNRRRSDIVVVHQNAHGR